MIVGDVKPEVKDLVVTTYEAWRAAIAYCRPGNKYQDIGGIIEDIISKKGIMSSQIPKLLCMLVTCCNVPM